MYREYEILSFPFIFSSSQSPKKVSSRGNFYKWRIIVTLLPLLIVVFFNSIKAEPKEILPAKSASTAEQRRLMENQRLITDMVGRKVNVPNKIRRIVALNASLRYVVYLQATELVVGIEGMEKQTNVLPLSSKNEPVSGRPYQAAIASQIEKLPVIGEGGPGKLPDFEALLAVEPDLVLTFEPEIADQVMKKTSLPAIVILYAGTEGVDFTEIKKSFTFLGDLLGREKRAKELNQFIDLCRADLQKRTAGVSPVSVYIGAISARGAHGITSTETNYPPLQWVTANNLADSLKQKGHVFIDREMLLLWDPQFIFIDSAGLSLVEADYQKNREFYSRLSAIKNKRVFTLFPFNFYRTNLEVLIANSYYIGKTLYPERFEDINPEEKAAEIIKFFVGADVFNWLKRGYRGFGHVDFLEDGLEVK